MTSKSYLYYLDKKILLEPEKSYTVGRDSDNIIQLPGLSISRHHAEIFFENDNFVIVDKKSTNGLFVNGKKVDKHILYDGDHINIRTFYLVFKETEESGFEKSEKERELTDTLVIEHQIAELLKSTGDKNILDKVLDLKLTMYKVKNKLDKLANRDRLTGLYNRRFFDTEIEKEIERAKRYDTTLCLLMIDIDHFKKVNDTYGHQKGDEALAAVSKIILKITRVNDLVARYGGEEIVILLPEIQKNNAVITAEKIRFSIEKESRKYSDIDITASIGVSFFNKESDDIETFIKKSDQALYIAKERGRNRVIVNQK